MKTGFLSLVSFLLFGFLLSFTLGCNQQNDCCINIDVAVSIHYQNQEGKNLINSSAEFDASNIKIYYKKEDEFVYEVKGNLGYPNFHTIEDRDGATVLTVFASYYYEGNKSTTLIELNPNVKDTLVCAFDLSNHNEVITNAWLNGNPVNRQLIVIKK
ncbi:MAG: hypothetical protein WAT79_06390 [Saprospiraceae bacterium]